MLWIESIISEKFRKKKKMWEKNLTAHSWVAINAWDARQSMYLHLHDVIPKRKLIDRMKWLNWITYLWCNRFQNAFDGFCVKNWHFYASGWDKFDLELAILLSRLNNVCFLWFPLCAMQRLAHKCKYLQPASQNHKISVVFVFQPI